MVPGSVAVNSTAVDSHLFKAAEAKVNITTTLLYGMYAHLFVVDKKCFDPGRTPDVCKRVTSNA